LASLALVGVGVYALFIVDATSTGSTFSTANPSLQLCNDVEGSANGCGAQIPNPINITDLLPGVPKTFVFWIYNSGGDLFDPITAVFNSPTNSIGSGSLETDLNISLDCGGFTHPTVGTQSFFDWETARTLQGGSLAGGASTRCTMTVELPSASTLINKTLNFNAVFSGSAGV
jgi:hypothetical protein